MSADLLARLIAAGTPAALVGEVAMALGRAAGDQEALAARRERDAERQRAKRDRVRASRDVTVHHVTSEDSADAAPSLDKKAPQTPKKINPIPCVIHATREEPGSGPSLTDVVTAWLGWIAILADRQRKRWKGMPPPAGVTDAQWRGFLEHRKAKRQTLTDRAYLLLSGKLAKLSSDEWPPGRIVDHMVERGWLSFEIDWLTKATDTRNGKRPHHSDRPANGHHNAMVAAVADAQADRVARGDIDLDGGWGRPSH